MNRGLILGALLFTQGCGPSRHDTQAHPQKPARSSEKPAPAWTVRMERHMCLSGCPVYRLDIDPDGSVVYRGEQNVKVEGEAVGKLDARSLADLGRALAAARL